MKNTQPYHSDKM